MNFPCIKCGLCCRMIGKVAHLNKFNNGNGVCIHLNDNLCNIYNTRPQICNVKNMYSFSFVTRMSEKKFIYENLKVCLELNKLFGKTNNIQKLEQIMGAYN